MTSSSKVILFTLAHNNTAKKLVDFVGPTFLTFGKKTNKRDSGTSPLRHYLHVQHAVGRLDVSISAPDMVTIPDLKIEPAKLKLVMEQWKQYDIVVIMENNHYGNGYDQEKIGYAMVLVMMVLMALLVCDMLCYCILAQKTLKK